MEKQTDEQVALSRVRETQQRFAALQVCSFDKGFHSAESRQQLQAHLKLAALPRKGKLSQRTEAIELASDFVQAKREPPAVESAINALEVHGLNRCPDHGVDGFKRYVALAGVARSPHRTGATLRDQETRRARRKSRLNDRAPPGRLAA
jgi:transposase, IS5 family